MKKLLRPLLFFVLFSCKKSSIELFESEESGQQVIVTDASGREYDLEPPAYQYCGPYWGRKFCRFFRKHDGTIWRDIENYYSDFSDIKFSNFNANDVYFISFFNLDSTVSYCKGWKLGKTTIDGITWNIKIKRDEEDVLWFDYEYYGTSDEIEYTTTYKYQVVDGLLHFSSFEGQTFIFSPSERNYSEDVLDTEEIIRLKGCMF